MHSESRATREIVHGDALSWLDREPPTGASVVTSLPDVSELPELGFDGWRAWFIATTRRLVRWVPEGGVAIFFQSDIRLHGALVDKGYLVMRAAEEEGARVIWHKIICRSLPGTIAHGRPSYSHMIAITCGPVPPPKSPGPDVLPDAGTMSWSRAMGVNACRVACRWLVENTTSRVVVDPFCGRGTVLAVANAMGLDAIGVERSAKRCRAARALVIDETNRAPAFALRAGARLFDDGSFFEAHEVWEEQWRSARSEPERLVLQGLIQIAAALHKLGADPPARESAARLVTKGLAKLGVAKDAVVVLDVPAFAAAFTRQADALVAGEIPLEDRPRLDEHMR